MSTEHLVCFQIGSETFGVDIFAVREIVRVQEITRVPGAPEFVLGVINLRGRIISVVDLGLQLGMGPTPVDRHNRILVIRLDHSTVGFLVKAATEVLKIPGEAIEPPPEMMAPLRGEYLEGIGKLGDRLVILLNLRKVLTHGQSAAAAATAAASELAASAR